MSNRRLLPFVLALAILAGACQGAPTAPAKPTEAPKPAAPAAAPAPAAPAPAASPAAAPGAAPAAASSPAATKPAGVPAGKTFTVGVFQFVSHPALDDSRKGVVQALADNGFKEGENVKFDFQNGQADIPTMTSIAQRYRDANVDVIVAISTPAMQASLNVTKESGKPPIVFDAVTDPYASAKDVIKSETDKPANITGIQALPPVKEAMQMVRVAVPSAKRLGIIWTPAEANSVVATGLARDAAKELNLELIEQTITKPDEVLQAAQSLVAKNIDVFFISTDSTVVTALESVVKVATENKKPLFGNDPASASRGAVAALGIDYFDQGYDSGAMVARILKGENPKEIPIARSKKGFLAVNLAAARSQGVTLPEEIVKQAAQKFEEIVPAKPKP